MWWAGCRFRRPTPSEQLQQHPYPQQQIGRGSGRDHLPTMNLERAAAIAITVSSVLLPSSIGIFFGRNHKSHCAASPGSQISRSAGSTGWQSGRSRWTLSRNQVIDPAQRRPHRDHHRGHVRRLDQQLPHRRFERRERCRHCWPLVFRRPVRSYRTPAIDRPTP